MKFFKKLMPSQREETVVDVPIEKVIQEMNNWVQVLQKKVPRVSKNIFFNSDKEEELLLNLKPIYGQLGGKPSKNYYMSRITQEIFEEEEHYLALMLDYMQVVVEQFIDKRKSLPIKVGSDDNEIDYSFLYSAGLLDEKPQIPLYIEDFGQGCFFVSTKPQKVTKRAP